MKRDSCFSTLGLLSLLCVSTLSPVQGGKVLVVPFDGSPWLSMQLLVKELSLRGHEIVVLVPDSSFVIKGSDYYRTENFHVPFSKADLVTGIEKVMGGLFLKPAGMADILNHAENLLNFTNLHVKGCEGLLYNQSLMQKLRDEDFQLMLTDPFLPCGPIIADAFSLPTVYFLRGIPCGLEEKATQCPAPMSFVPRLFSENPDRMDFLQRIKNVLIALLEEHLCRKIYASFDELSNRYLQRDITYKELISQGALWLLRYDFTFEFPKPIMPNMVFVGGISCAKRRALPEELQKFVEESGEHGFVVFTLGSMVSQIPEEKANQFFEAFRQIPQRVLWRYTGATPDNIPENVKLMKWMPQNDLLGHPKARAFITHGGIHGIYEGICNGVPMVMLPLFGDQSDNVQRMAQRGVGEVLKIFDVTTATLLETLNKVIHDKSYKEKMIKLSAMHKDRPIEPVDLAVFWLEFVMRHKGAHHLRPASHELNWIQYHSLDVIGLLLIIVLTVVMMTVYCCTFCFRKCYKRKTLKKKNE